ncbi:TrbI F-type domain-containing protein [Vibrio artabrorum]|uniref:hypothetical protein n=1 Tax=Vibrio artabrorum TaxID=446374 RepID=UPI00354E2F56
MNRLTLLLSHGLSASLAVVVTWVLVSQASFLPAQPLVSLDKKALIARFDAQLSAPTLTERERVAALDQFSVRLMTLIHQYETQSGAVVLNRSALITPLNDITDEVEARMKREWQ